MFLASSLSPPLSLSHLIFHFLTFYLNFLILREEKFKIKVVDGTKFYKDVTKLELYLSVYKLQPLFSLFIQLGIPVKANTFLLPVYSSQVQFVSSKGQIVDLPGDFR